MSSLNWMRFQLLPLLVPPLVPKVCLGTHIRETRFHFGLTSMHLEPVETVLAVDDPAVLDAYGWPHDLSDEQILERLLALNLERARAQRSGLLAAADSPSPAATYFGA